MKHEGHGNTEAHGRNVEPLLTPRLTSAHRLEYAPRRALAFTLEGRYAQGSLTPETGTLGDGEDLVDGLILLRVQVREWLSVAGGPRLRAFVTPAGTSRWSRIEARARVEGEVIDGLAYAHFEGWYALAVDANVQGGGSGAQGGEAGLSVRLRNTPVALQLTYTADRATFSNGGSEFLEGVSLALRLARF